MEQFRCPNGLRVWSAPRTGREIKFIFREIFEDRCYEQQGVSIGDGDVILDIGANVGLFALSLMERFRDLKIFCLEPAPITRGCLTRNLAESPRRDLHQVKVLSDAVGADNADAMITYFSRAPGNSTLFPAEKHLDWDRIIEDIGPAQVRRIHKGLGLLPRWLIRLITEALMKPLLRDVVVQPCKVRPLSDVMAQLDLTRIDLLKIDVEGAEIDVLRGIAAPAWRRIRQLAMEVSPGHKGSLSELIGQLHARGFRKVAAEGFAGGACMLDDPMPCMLYAVR